MASTYICEYCKGAPLTHDGRFRRRYQWKTEKGFREHRCYKTEQEEAAANIADLARRLAERDALWRAWLELDLYQPKIGEPAIAVTSRVVKPTHERRGERHERGTVMDTETIALKCITYALNKLYWEAPTDLEIRTDYSGRAMYGDRCIGLVATNTTSAAINLTVLATLAAVKESPDDYENLGNEVAGLLANAREDSMERSGIIYWPFLTLEALRDAAGSMELYFARKNDEDEESAD